MNVGLYSSGLHFLRSLERGNIFLVSTYVLIPLYFLIYSSLLQVAKLQPLKSYESK